VLIRGEDRISTSKIRDGTIIERKRVCCPVAEVLFVRQDLGHLLGRRKGTGRAEGEKLVKQPWKKKNSHKPLYRGCFENEDRLSEGARAQLVRT